MSIKVCVNTKTNKKQPSKDKIIKHSYNPDSYPDSCGYNPDSYPKRISKKPIKRK